ncbi:bacteriohemerythrin [Magnetococcales bacterium HHB-1]
MVIWWREIIQNFYRRHLIMDEQAWINWIMQTARSWSDISEIIRKTGLDNVDEDHRRMTELVLELNKLIDLFEGDHFDLQAIKREGILFQRLYQSAKDHFLREEKIMRTFDLPRQVRHRAQHKLFLELLDRYIQDFKAGRLAVSLNVKTTILAWWIEHINQTDYATFCHSNWVPAVLERATSWDQLSELVRKMGIKELDDDHKDLVVLTLELNGLIDRAEKEGQLPEALRGKNNLLRRIYQYADNHFQREEQFIKRYGIDGLEQQVEEHSAFLSMLRDYDHAFQTGKMLPTHELKREIMAWWVHHINHTDYQTFRLENWNKQVLRTSDSLDDVSELIRMTGIEHIDYEHIDLVLLTLEFNAFLDRIDKDGFDDQMREQCAHLLSHLIDFSEGHFEHEIELIKQYDIPGLEVQEMEHAYFLSMLRDSHKNILSGRLIPSAAIKESIMAWWVSHINQVDYEMFRLENWAAPLFREATRWEDVSHLILKTHIPEIDSDHQNLVEVTFRLNALCDQVDDNPERNPWLVDGEKLDLFSRLFHMVEDHFQREEEIMKELNLIGQESHQDKHRLFMDMMRAVDEKRTMTIKDKPLMLELKETLLIWWINHINNVDYIMFQTVSSSSEHYL